MRKTSLAIIVLSVLFCSATSAPAEVNIGLGIGIGTPNVSIGINLGHFPELAPVPGYPVYYAPRVAGNYFFYDGLYWVYVDSNWYASEWYDGPWWVVQPEYVPVYILRVPVRYYRHPPPYFREWRRDAPPRWGHLWGPRWERDRRGWDRWDRRHVPQRAPLPVYQREYRGDRYPARVEEQHDLRLRHYRYQPRDKGVRQHFQQRSPEGAGPGRRDMRGEPGMRGPGRHVEPQRPEVPSSPPSREHGREIRQPVEQPRDVREREAPPPRGHEPRYEQREQHQGSQGHGRGHEQRREEERGRER